jgi:hypothetical protein
MLNTGWKNFISPKVDEQKAAVLISDVLPFTLLATSDPIAATAIVDHIANQFNFTGVNQVALVAGTKYAITLEYNGPSGLYYYFYEGGLHSGYAVQNNGSGWVGSSSGIINK